MTFSFVLSPLNHLPLDFSDPQYLWGLFYWHIRVLQNERCLPVSSTAGLMYVYVIHDTDSV